MSYHEGDPRVKVQVGWIIQQTELILGLLSKQPPEVDTARREVAFLLAVVERPWAAENAEKTSKLDAYEEAMKDFGW